VSEGNALTPLSVALSPRPFRAVVFVARVPGVPWRALYRFALRCQTATWGGWANIVLPMPQGDASDDELLWALLDVFDADTYHSLPVRPQDLEDLAPDFYRETVEEASHGLPASFDTQMLGARRAHQLVPLMLDDELQRHLVQRVAPYLS
jgi:hypothetical protein